MRQTGERSRRTTCHIWQGNVNYVVMKPRTAIKSLLAISFWGASFVATKIVVQQISPLAVIVLRFGLGWSVLMLICLKRRQIVWIKGRELLGLALLGLNGITVHQLLQ